MKILIATDGSDYSRQAIEKACEILKEVKNKQIKIISVFEEIGYTATEPFAVSTEYVREMEKLRREQSTKFINEAIGIIQEKLDDLELSVTTKVTKGSAGKTIVEEAEDWEADLIVVGSHGYGFWARAFMGSTSDKIIHHAPCSVLVVRKEAD